jgi:hypothetical protein
MSIAFVYGFFYIVGNKVALLLMKKAMENLIGSIRLFSISMDKTNKKEKEIHTQGVINRLALERPIAGEYLPFS